MKENSQKAYPRAFKKKAFYEDEIRPQNRFSRAVTFLTACSERVKNKIIEKKLKDIFYLIVTALDRVDFLTKNRQSCLESGVVGNMRMDVDGSGNPVGYQDWFPFGNRFFIDI